MFMDFNLGDYKIPEASDVIKQLVKKFECNLDDYKNSVIRKNNLNRSSSIHSLKPWVGNVDNISGAAPQYRDVIFRILLRLVVVLKYLITVLPWLVGRCSLWRRRSPP
jgi:hypothetical protein